MLTVQYPKLDSCHLFTILGLLLYKFVAGTFFHPIYHIILSILNDALLFY